MGHSQADIDAVIAPVAPHDDFSFDELSMAYNLKNVSDRARLFVRLLRKEMEGREGKVRVLDIGCGNGISSGANARLFLRAIAEKADELWGVEPDASIVPDHGLFTNFQHALMEDAEIPEDYFDLAYSFMVMEHVADPEAFLKKVFHSLKPGGVYIFVTPNGHHYFTLIANMAKKIKLDEALLRVLRGQQKVDDYHYPVCYQCNRHDDVERHARSAGFGRVQTACAEITGPKPYLPGPLRMIWWLMMKKRDLIKNPKILLNLYVRLQK